MAAPRVHIVSGPSSCGKSQFIRGLDGTYDKLVFPDTLKQSPLLPGERYVLHYNLLRPHDRLTKLRGSSSLEDRARSLVLGLRMSVQNPFRSDRPLRLLRSGQVEASATVLVASRAELERRMRTRDARETLVEDGLDYPRERWLTVLATANLSALYRDWIEFLRSCGISYRLVDANTPDYVEIASLGEMDARLTGAT